MRTIIITGPSGSGKTILTNKLLKIFKDSLVIKTDSYYRDSIFFRLLSILKIDIYDRLISIKINEINKILNDIYNKEKTITFLHYDFKRRKSSKIKKDIRYKGENQFLILEGIFSHRLDLNYKDTININCIEQKNICLKRRIKRDEIERGRNNQEVNKKFDTSWYLFYQNIKKYMKNNKVFSINTIDNDSYQKLIFNLKKIKKNN